MKNRLRRKKIGLSDVCVFTQQLSSMLVAGLPLVQALEALQEQTEHPVFQIIIREVKADVSSGTAFSDAVRKFPRAFPNLFISMVEAGEASGGLASILGKVATYFEQSVKLTKKVKGAMTYPVGVIAPFTFLVEFSLNWNTKWQSYCLYNNYLQKWCGHSESNRGHQLGRLGFYR